MEEEKATKGIPIKDAVGLMQQLDKTITYGSSNLNAQQISEAKKEDWQKAKSDYLKWAKTMGIHKSGLVLLCYLAMGAIVLWKAGSIQEATGLPDSIFRFVGGMLIFYSVQKTFERIYHSQGYVDGYSAGFDEGMNKAWGLKGEDLKDISERAIEMELHGELIDKWNSEKKQS